jgi:virulence factor Mce-like protein
MNKAAPSLPRIIVMVVFALSCFGLLLFLWLSFGGPVPLKPKGYQVKIDFPEATTLATEADVRVAGVPVGKVRKVEVGDGTNRTVATVELERRYAPLRSDARAVLRQKTLLGETYVELTPGRSEEKIPEGGELPDGQVKPTVELDEIFDSLDPATRAAFKGWQTELAKGIKGRGRDFNDALGTLPGFASDGADVLAVLDSQEGAVTRLVKNTGVVFAALTQNEAQLRNLITGSKRTFDATASKNDELAETIRIFPTFLNQS